MKRWGLLGDGRLALDIIGDRPSWIESEEDTLTKLLMLVISTIGSYVGWWLGARIGTMTAFILSMVGLGVGLYAGREVARRFEP